jgi:uncharacterized tellurite resistance protein B-like protein
MAPMGILAAVVAAIGVVITLLIRLNMAADAAKGLAETTADTRGLFRRWKWRRKLAADQLAMVEDARVAVGVMLVAAAQNDGALTAREQEWLLAQFSETLGLSPKGAQELLAHARFIAKDAVDLDNCFRRLAPVIVKRCGPAERADCVRLLNAVISLEGPASVMDQHAVDRIASTLSA